MSAEPYLLKDLNVAPASSSLQELVDVNGTAFFVAADTVFGLQLWKSDGTADGTRRVTGIGEGTAPQSLTAVDDALFFTMDDGVHGRELWRSDGTEAGTVLVKDLRPGSESSNPSSLVLAGDWIFFLANRGSGTELWQSDGTPAGTVCVSGAPSGPSNLVHADGYLYFTQHGELWRTGGNSAGTSLVANLPGQAKHLINAGGTLYVAVLQSSQTWELWRSDGTSAGTQRIKAFPADQDELYYLNPTAVGKTVFFKADDGIHGRELWKSDGTEPGTEMVADLQPGSAGSDLRDLASSNGRLYFTYVTGGQGELWASDGTMVGTQPAPFATRSTSFRWLGDRHGTLYYAKSGGLWKAVLTAAGSWKPSHVHGAFRSGLFYSSGAVYFLASDTSHGAELWKYDEDGLVPVFLRDINPGTNSSYQQTAAAFGGTVFVNNHNTLWRSDGTEAGTNAIGSLSLSATSLPVNVDGTVYFAAYASDEGGGLWATDGTPAGTRVIVQQEAESLMAVDNLLFFLVLQNGVETLWKSDGTSAGTVRVRELLAPWLISKPSDYAVMRGVLYFIARSAQGTPMLWRSDGTAAGTVPLDLAGAGQGWSSPAELTEVNGVLFLTATDNQHGRELWRTDGTVAGTWLVRDIRPRGLSSYPTALANIGGTRYFSARDEAHGVELWKSDGTGEGTALVRDIRPGGDSSSPNFLTDVGGRVVFSATDGAHGRELWTSDGTAEGTALVVDLVPGAGSSAPRDLVLASGVLHFSAANEATGREPWALHVQQPEAEIELSSAMIPADTPPGAVLGILSNTDPDPTRRYTNRLAAGGPDQGAFAVDGDRLRTSADFVYGTQRSYHVRIRLTDQGGLWREQDLTLTAPAVNLPPVPRDDDYRLDANTTLVEAAPGVLQNDGDPEGAVLTVALADDVRHGRLTLHQEGSFRYTPDPGFRGIDRFTYYALDDAGRSAAVATVYLRVGPPQLISNIDATAPGASAEEFLEIDGTIFFTADDGIHGSELWKSDGTAEGTVLIKDLLPGVDGSSARDLAELNGLLFFVASDEGSGSRLWRSDGTAAGTKPVHPAALGSAHGPLVHLNERLYFAAADAAGRWGLWATDGTDAGTLLAADVDPFHPASFVVSGGTLYFSGGDETQGYELWRSDGTAAGTWRVSDIAPTADGSRPLLLGEVNGRLFFAADDGVHGFELWTSDGTAEGTTLVRDMNPGDASSLNFTQSLVELDGVAYFFADDGVHGKELWRSDGTAAGTTLVADLEPGSRTSNPNTLVRLHDRIYFIADIAYGSKLWQSDGTAAGTQILNASAGEGVYPFARNLTKAGNTLYFSGYASGTGAELWKSDGTAAGTTMVKDIFAGSSSADPDGWVEASGLLYFLAADGLHGAGLWRSDGTEAGTGFVRALNPGDADSTGYRPSSFFQVGSLIYFCATNGILGDELWKTDGTSAGTGMVMDLAPGLSLMWPDWLTELNGNLYFTAYTGGYSRRFVWTTDGTSAGTKTLDGLFPEDSSARALVRADDAVFVTLYNPQSARDELWKTNGTAAGTALIRDFPVGGLSQVASASASLGGVFYFLASDGIHGRELWKTDGTRAGTEMITNFVDDNYGRFATIVAAVQRLFLTFDDAEYARDLWISDGTGAGTVLVARTWPGGRSAPRTAPVVVGDTAYFVGYSETHGTEVWKSDGTAAGTVLVKDIAPGTEWSSPSSLTNVNGTLYFVAQTAAVGREVWKTDGTEAGTVLVRDLVPGGGSSFASSLTSAGGTLYFSATDGIHGVELWKTNGTAASTRLVADIMPGPDSSSPRGMTVVGQSLAFTATDGRTGRERWIVPLVVAPWCNPVDPFDVSGNGRVEPLDILAVINYVNAHPGQATLPPRRTPDEPYYDVTEDNRVTALDVLSLINYLNLRDIPSGEGESKPAPTASAAQILTSPCPQVLGAGESHDRLASSARRLGDPVAGSRRGQVVRHPAMEGRAPRFPEKPQAERAEVDSLELDEIEQALEEISGDVARLSQRLDGQRIFTLGASG